jgi:hypothetical protein
MLLEEIKALVELERSLTDAIENAEPWLPGGRSRPLPSSMQEVEQVLHVARNLASRTSAPAGWNPQAPVLGFTTPNPLPHQLRGGALGALQLEMARKHQQQVKQEQLDRKREREEAKKKEDEKAVKRPSLQTRQTSTRQVQRQRQPSITIVADMNLSDDESGEDDSEEE